MAKVVLVTPIYIWRCHDKTPWIASDEFIISTTATAEEISSLYLIHIVEHLLQATIIWSRPTQPKFLRRDEGTKNIPKPILMSDEKRLNQQTRLVRSIINQHSPTGNNAEHRSRRSDPGFDIRNRFSKRALSPEGRMMQQPVTKPSRPQHPVKYLRESLDVAPIDDINQLKPLKKNRLNARYCPRI